MVARTTSLKLLPEISRAAMARADQLNLPFSTYVGILVWNHGQAAVALQAEPDSRREKRIHVPCSWRGGLRKTARTLARQAGLTINAFVEALIARDLRSTETGLIILPSRGSARPRLS